VVGFKAFIDVLQKFVGFRHEVLNRPRGDDQTPGERLAAKPTSDLGTERELISRGRVFCGRRASTNIVEANCGSVP
jgi:hypothetical protein